MFAHSVYFVDIAIISQILIKNIWYMTKLLLVAYIVFYWIPTKIFPQEQTGVGVQKIVFNFIFMVAYVETVVPFLILIKAFSLFLFIFSLFLTKLLFGKFYYKRDIFLELDCIKIDVMMWFFNLMDKTKEVKNTGIKYFGKKLLRLQRSMTVYTMLKQVLFFSIFSYIILTLMARGMSSYSNPIPDASQFIDWVVSLGQNILYSDSRSAGADFYGQAIIIFFVNTFTNIDPIILFSLYPTLLLLALYFSIYYVIRDFTGSSFVAIFAVMVHGIIFMSPLSDIILGKIIVSQNIPIANFYNFKIYLPTLKDAASIGVSNGNVPYLRYISGLAYEHSSVFVLLNSYFLIKTLDTHIKKYLFLYALTLMLVFIFHGGGAIVLIIISLLVAINAVIFGKITPQILKSGLLYIIIASIVGNFWILSMIKYGIPQDFGAAAPFLDKLFGTARNMHEISKVGTKTIAVSDITNIHVAFFLIMLLAFFLSIISKRKFANTSFILIAFGVFIAYFGPNFGLPLVAKQSRLAEYLFFAMTVLASFSFYYLVDKPISFAFKKYSKMLIMIIIYSIFFITTLTVPRWIDTDSFWKNINAIEYTSISEVILKINSQNRPFTWTVVSYVQEYAKVRDKGYHINTQNFLLRYNPNSSELKIDTPKIYIFIENFPNQYKGKGEWYYRWRRNIQDDIKSWVAMYSATHSNIRIYYKTKTITTYEIDNSDYVERMKKLRRLKNGHF